MDTTEPVTNAGQEAAPQQSLLNVGMALREARERMGMSVSDIADRIKFAPRQVEALESNDFAHLPQATFLRGFVRSYARVLQLDETALISALPVEPSHAVAKAQVVNVAFPTVRLLQRVNLPWLAGTLGVALVLALFVLLYDGRPAATPSEVVVESLPLPTPDTASAVPAAPVTTTPVTTTPVTTTPVTAAPAARSSEIAKAPAKTVVPVKASPVAVAPAPQVMAASAPAATGNAPVALDILKRRPMHIVFTGDTWAEVVDVNGDLLLSRTNLSGTEKWIGGPRRAPYDVTISPPENAKLYYRGKEIDLSPYAGTGTARLKVE